jgi:conjugal transfer pilus assembly protein TraB
MEIDKLKAKRVLYITAAVIVLFGVALLMAVWGDKKKQKSPSLKKPEVTIYREGGLTGVEQFTSDMNSVRKSLSDLTKIAEKQQSSMETLNQRVSELEKPQSRAKHGDSPDRERDAPAERVPEFNVKRETLDLKAAPPLAPPLPRPLAGAGPIGVPAPAVPPVSAAEKPGQPAASVQPRQINITDSSGQSFDFKKVKEEKAQAFEAAFDAKKAQNVFMPVGSMFTAVMLTGASMPTSAATQKNPIPMVFRVKREAILANFASIDVRDCFLLASGYGQMATERVILRGEALTCVRPDGGVLETPLSAYIVGSDGQVGVAGRLTSKQGQLIANALLGGTISGLASPLQRSRVPALNLAPGAGSIYEDESMGQVLQSGVAGGFSQTASAIAKHYLKLAEETFPVIDVAAGEVVTVVVSQGVPLPLKGSTSLNRIAADSGDGAVRTALHRPTSQPKGGEAAAQKDPAKQPQAQPVWQSGAAFGTPEKDSSKPESLSDDINSAIRNTLGALK